MRDFFLTVAQRRAFRPYWSTGVLDETRHENVRQRLRQGVMGGEAERRADHLVEALRESFSGAEMPFERDMPTTVVWTGTRAVTVDPDRLPDPKDAHVIAAAVAAEAELIVSEDSTGFPVERLPAGIVRRDAQQFVELLAEEQGDVLFDALITVSGNTGMTPGALLAKFERDFEWDRAVEAIRALRRPTPRMQASGPPPGRHVERPQSDRIPRRRTRGGHER